MTSYYGGLHSRQSTAYQSYSQLDICPTFYQRSRALATQAVPPKIHKMMYIKRNHGYAVDPYFFEHRNYCGLWKDAGRWPMYRRKKRSSVRIQRYQESEFRGSPIDRQPRHYHGLHRSKQISDTLQQYSNGGGKLKLIIVQWDMQPIVLRRIRPYYAPSYATYPPSIMNAVRTKEEYCQRYSIMMKVSVKAIELLLGAATIALIVAPMRKMSIYAFVKMTQTEWQGLILGFSALFLALCLVMLFGACLAYRYVLWRRLDYLITVVGSFGHLIIGVIEVYYAICPNGEKFDLVCYRLEWIIASVLLLINATVYVTDCVLSFRTGISML
ncbi:unnamed protein product [Litomosoides sigmodontis]|uniref:MARVEL domain-containing protein n=1 Tax=Litomosoides sigmodontis TaxID=42156 RepID=A0A3P6SVD7_LITSI|nr:unnamed protein product [Litomosoides sigmodontis]